MLLLRVPASLPHIHYIVTAHTPGANHPRGRIVGARYATQVDGSMIHQTKPQNGSEEEQNQKKKKEGKKKHVKLSSNPIKHLRTFSRPICDNHLKRRL